MFDIYGNEPYNGQLISGMAKSLLMYIRDCPLEEIRKQQELEKPIGGWHAAHHKLVNEMKATCPEGFEVCYAPYDLQNRHVITYMPVKS